MNTRCPICQTDTMAQPVSLACNHSFCRGCILKYTVERGGATCPLCRRNICKFDVMSTLQDRPFTRGCGGRVHNDFLNVSVFFLFVFPQ